MKFALKTLNIKDVFESRYNFESKTATSFKILGKKNYDPRRKITNRIINEGTALSNFWQCIFKITFSPQKYTPATFIHKLNLIKLGI